MPEQEDRQRIADELSAEAKVVFDKVIAAYDAANDEDRVQATAIVNKAKKGDRTSEIVNLRPGAAAILFFELMNGGVDLG